MRIRLSSIAVALSVALCGGGVQTLVAQGIDSVPPATGTFIGHVVASLDSSPARSVEIRLLFVDSSKTVKTRRGEDSLDVFLDSIRTRIAVTDSTGAFAIRRLTPGHYLFRLRRIGFQPMDGVLTVAADTLRVKFVMDVASRLLAKVQITETSVDEVKDRLDKVGYEGRIGLGMVKTFIGRGEILRRKSQTLGEILRAHGIYDGDFLIDHLELPFEDVSDYPAELVIGIEIYPHSRPVEFNMTRPHAGPITATTGLNLPLVLIWTFMPSR